MTGQPMREDDPMRQSGAVWCGEHDRWECARDAKRTGLRCHGNAISGTDRCRMHAGRPAALVKALGEANLAAWTSAARTGDGPKLDPGQVVLDQLRVAVMRADIYGELLRSQLERDEASGLVGVTHSGQGVETGERVRGLARLEAEERDRVVRFAKVAHDMGIDERYIELEQGKAQLVTAAFLAALQAVSLLPGDRDLMLRTFLAGLGRGPELVEGVSA